ncbi:MAG: transaldolase [Nitratiruptor sp.]|nr:transaldolase [Nitratiruptor sp.]NPA83447.1 transaldolase [Campylobacterota bacterium]
MYLPQIHFSLWLDFIERSFLEDHFPTLIEHGQINGATSNPAIFKEAILSSPAYASQLEELQGLPPKERYEALAIEDIKRAARLLLPLYEAGDDGFVSIEVDPRLHDDAQATIAEAKRLIEAIAMPNVMIKIPATPAGYRAMEALAREGIHINATLIFSPQQALESLQALQRAGNPQSYGVLSIFVSRFDRKLDPHLPSHLRGKSGIMNAAAIYNLLMQHEAPNIRPLFASTSVKGGDYPPHYYITNLLAPNAINTAPLATIQAFIAHGAREPALPIPQGEIDKFFAQLHDNGVDIASVSRELLEEGLAAFVQAFEEILKELA